MAYNSTAIGLRKNCRIVEVQSVLLMRFLSSAHPT